MNMIDTGHMKHLYLIFVLSIATAMAGAQTVPAFGGASLRGTKQSGITDRLPRPAEAPRAMQHFGAAPDLAPARAAGGCLLDSAYHYDSSDEHIGINFYHYDAQGNLIEQIYKYPAGSAWENSMRYTWTYDAQGNLTGQVNQLWTGTAWENSWSYNSTYDA